MVVKLFGITKDIVGINKILIEPKDHIHTVGDLKSWLSFRYPTLGRLPSLAIAVDCEYAGDSHIINTNSEVALIPPVSGG